MKYALAICILGCAVGLALVQPVFGQGGEDANTWIRLEQ